MRRTHDLDAKDREILALLEEDARRSNSEIARLTSLSAPTVAERIARLRDIGVIRGFTTRVDAQRVGLPVSAIIEFRPNTMSDNEAAQFMRRFPQVRDCYRVTGTALLVVIVRVADNEGLRSLLGELYKHGETRTSVILTTEFEQRPVFAGKDEPSIGG
jgi:Lrp/AsnC family transcriptional regulator, leucine-responsive regulatory protein